ncbi:hypothetical protein FRC01_005347, partial [Tulasnella sp. 417]
EWASQREDKARSNLLQLPEMSALPRLRRLEIDGIPSQITPEGLLLNNVRSLSLIDVSGVQGEQLLEVLRNSPYLERLELGRSPLACPPQPGLIPIHLPHLMALQLIFMPAQVSNFLLATIHAPNCSELFISSHFPELPDNVIEHLFTDNTKHFSPVLQKLLTRGRYKDIHVFRLEDQSIDFHLQFHDEDFDYSVDQGILRLEFKFHSIGQLEGAVRWLIGYLNRDLPKIRISLFLDEIEEVRLLNLLDSHMAIINLAFRALSGPGFVQPSPILVHMAHPTSLHWPLPSLETFSYGVVNDESHNEMMLTMLRRRYGSNSNETDGERNVLRPLKRMRIESGEKQSVYLLVEAQKILPQAVTSLIEEDDSIW